MRSGSRDALRGHGAVDADRAIAIAIAIAIGGHPSRGGDTDPVPWRSGAVRGLR